VAITLKKNKEPAASAAPAVPPMRKIRKAPKPSNNQSFVVFIGDEGAILVATRGNKVLRRLFAPSPQPEHMKSMVELMQSQPNVPIYLLLDVIDQQYVRQTFPPVSSLSVTKLVNRRLERDFPPEDIKGALPLGRDSTGRKEWSYLLVALAKTPQLQIWLDTLLEMPNECKGFHLTPVEGQLFIPELLRAVAPDQNAPWKLLVSHNKVGGVRQIVLRDGKLAFTRLTQTPDDSNFALTAGNIEQEIQNTLDYLRRLGFTDNRDMNAVVIASQEVKELIDLKRFAMGFASCVTPYEVSELMNLEQAALSGDRYGDVVVAAAFAMAKKKGYTFMSGYAKQLSQMFMARKAIKALVMAIAALCFLSVIDDTLTIVSNSEAESRAREELQAADEQAAQAQKSISALDTDTSLWTSVVSVYDAYTPDKHLPTEFIESLSRVLEPSIRVSQINWSRPVPDPNAPPPAPVAPGQPEPLPVGSITAEVEMEFNGSYEDQDQYIKAVEAYFEKLKATLPQYDISSANMPGKGDGAAKVEISFDQKQTQPFQQGQNKVRFKFEGPREIKPDPNAPPPPPAEPDIAPVAPTALAPAAEAVSGTATEDVAIPALPVPDATVPSAVSVAPISPPDTLTISPVAAPAPNVTVPSETATAPADALVPPPAPLPVPPDGALPIAPAALPPLPPEGAAP